MFSYSCSIPEKLESVFELRATLNSSSTPPAVLIDASLTALSFLSMLSYGSGPVLPVSPPPPGPGVLGLSCDVSP